MLRVGALWGHSHGRQDEASNAGLARAGEGYRRRWEFQLHISAMVLCGPQVGDRNLTKANLMPCRQAEALPFACTAGSAQPGQFPVRLQWRQCP